MKKLLSASLVVAAILFAQTSFAQYKTALGVRLSSSQAMVSNSISLKHFLSESTAVEALFSFGDPLALGAMLEVHKPLATEGLNWFYGGGGYLGFVKVYDPNRKVNDTEVNFGAMGVLGLDYKFMNLPLNLSLDWKPELNIVNDITFEPSAIGLSVRFVF
ncbi:MAG: hypothetical protein E6Q24_12345 [Chitinophagaceae bacterium]|jgi:hypothetical protein|nr:hypothetical protein [Sphingobacteriales bacterium]OJV97729.1 MAG: hypothetical protein BGO52_10155 [Sphingobacteriales bacterium 44-61]TXJ26402.1 MAG: hypothetical protein E6Q24_12345 [Chitinophagaceae bacterium]